MITFPPERQKQKKIIHFFIFVVVVAYSFSLFLCPDLDLAAKLNFTHSVWPNLCYIARRCDWLEILALLFQPIQEMKTNRHILVCVFPCLAPILYIYFEFWLVHLIFCVSCDWLEQFLCLFFVIVLRHE